MTTTDKQPLATRLAAAEKEK
ncbi:hypothetical protein, partial [Klebsiella pneumoniae]